MKKETKIDYSRNRLCFDGCDQYDNIRVFFLIVLDDRKHGYYDKWYQAVLIDEINQDYTYQELADQLYEMLGDDYEIYKDGIYYPNNKKSSQCEMSLFDYIEM